MMWYNPVLHDVVLPSDSASVRRMWSDRTMWSIFGLHCDYRGCIKGFRNSCFVCKEVKIYKGLYSG